MAEDDGRFAQLGPFTGGMNTYSQQSAIGDNELVECVNFIPDVDGSLKCRPPLVETFSGGATFNFRTLKMIGSGIIGGVNYIFGSNETGVWRSTDGAVWNLTSTPNVDASVAVQYKDNVYFVAEPGSAQPGGRWTGGAWVSIPTMPRGQGAVIFKERMWITPGKHAFANTSRLSFSAIADPNTWNAPDFFDITPGDGSNLVDLAIFNNNLLLFKQGSTFYLSYDTKPADSVVTKISNNIGSSNWRCIAQHANEIFVMHEDNVYQLVNFNWVKLNTKVPFVLDGASPGWTGRIIHTFLSIVGSWLICKYHRRVYVYNIDTQTWTRWTSLDEVLRDFGPLTQMPADDLFNQSESYYCGTSLEFATSIIRIRDGWDAATIERSITTPQDIECYLETKTYSFDIPWKFKRMFSWGAECVTSRAVEGIAVPYSITDPPWVVTNIPGVGGAVLKRFYRFPKGLRFREIGFRVKLLSSGATTDGLAQLYILMAVVRDTETVPKAVN